MLGTCGLLQACCSGYRDYNQPRVGPSLRHRLNGAGITKGSSVVFGAKRLGCGASRGFAGALGCVYASSVGRGHSEMRHGDEFSEEPFWLGLTKDFVGVIKSFFGFLVDQPRQLRYIEWPTFSSTLKTATLTLVLVALLIVALSTVDSGLCYLLALFLRRKP